MRRSLVHFSIVRGLTPNSFAASFLSPYLATTEEAAGLVSWRGIGVLHAGTSEYQLEGFWTVRGPLPTSPPCRANLSARYSRTSNGTLILAPPRPGLADAVLARLYYPNMATRGQLEFRKRFANRDVQQTEIATRFFEWLAEVWTDPHTGKMIRFKCGACGRLIKDFPLSGDPEHRNYELRCHPKRCGNNVRWTEATMKRKLKEAQETGTHVTVS